MNESIKNSASDNENIRKNFTLPSTTVNKIADLRAELGNPTNSKIVSMSVALMDLIVEAQKNGDKVILQDANGKVRELALLL